MDLDAAPQIVLASASAVRGALLKNAGVAFLCDPAHIDEDAFHRDERLNAGQTAIHLAEAKAKVISKTHPDALVIGCDQVLAWQGQILTKPGSKDNVERQLKTLRGQTHELVSAVAVVHNEQMLWSYADQATLTMRDFSDAFLHHYIARVGDDVTESVGGYHMEGLGAQLFAKIEGDYFTILGLPLMALLTFLRSQKALET